MGIQSLGKPHRGLHCFSGGFPRTIGFQADAEPCWYYSRSQKVGTSVSSVPYTKEKGNPAPILLNPSSNFLGFPIGLTVSGLGDLGD